MVNSLRKFVGGEDGTEKHVGILIWESSAYGGKGNEGCAGVMLGKYA